MTSYCFFPKKGNIRCRAAFNPRKNLQGQQKNARFSRIFPDLSSQQPLLIYITQHAKRQDKESSPIASSASRTGRKRFFYSRALLF